MTDWQPIETAPKDGTYILAVSPKALKSWGDEYGSESGPWIVQWRRDRDCWRIQLDGQSCSPTHWMPLPDPPK